MCRAGLQISCASNQKCGAPLLCTPWTYHRAFWPVNSNPVCGNGLILQDFCLAVVYLRLLHSVWRLVFVGQNCILRSRIPESQVSRSVQNAEKHWDGQAGFLNVDGE